MSRALKRKHILREVWEDNFALPKEDQQIVRVLSGKGNNLHEVRSAQGNVFLVSMPKKFRRTIWVKKGQYVLIEPICEGHKVKGEIVKILTRDHIRIYYEGKVWPNAFEDDAVQNHNAYPPNYKGIQLQELKSDGEEDGSNEEDSESEKRNSEGESYGSDRENQSDESDPEGESNASDPEGESDETDSEGESNESDSDDNCKESDNEDNNINVNSCNDKNGKSVSNS